MLEARRQTGSHLRGRLRRAAEALPDWLVIACLAVGTAYLTQALVVKPYRIPSASMLPSLAVGERVLVDRIGGRLGTPELGDIVVFNPPEGAEFGRCGVPVPPGAACPAPTPRHAEDAYIKRVVAGPGDEVGVRDGRLVRNGRLAPARSPGRCEGSSCDLPRTVTIPPGHWFVMGDNRGASSDSRFWGPVREDWIIGEAFLTYWPPWGIGPLGDERPGGQASEGRELRDRRIT